MKRDDLTEQHDAQTRGSMWHAALGLAHLWLTSTYVRLQRLPTPSTFYVYSDSFGSGGWGYDILKDKRIKVTIEIEDFSERR